jgi:hypothetical protein
VSQLRLAHNAAEWKRTTRTIQSRTRRRLHISSSIPAREREREGIPRPVVPFAPFRHAQLECVILGSWDPGQGKSTTCYRVEHAACGIAQEQQIILNDGSLAATEQSHTSTPNNEQWSMVNGSGAQPCLPVRQRLRSTQYAEHSTR